MKNVTLTLRLPYKVVCEVLDELYGEHFLTKAQYDRKKIKAVNDSLFANGGENESETIDNVVKK